MGLTRREVRLLRESENPPSEDEFYLHPEVMRAVAKKMRERTAPPDIHTNAQTYALAKLLYDFCDALEAVADDTQERAFRYITPQKDVNG